jgi:hypothetical protein
MQKKEGEFRSAQRVAEHARYVVGPRQLVYTPTLIFGCFVATEPLLHSQDRSLTRLRQHFRFRTVIFHVHIFFIAMLLQSHRVSPYHFHPHPLLCRCLIISDSTFSIACTGRSPVQPDASPNTSQGGSSSSSPLSARGKLVSMVRVFKEDIQKRKEESDRKSGKGASGPLLLSTFCLSILSSFSFFCSLAGARFKFSIGSHRLMCF